MPIGEGVFVDVLVTYVVSPDEIYVQKVSTMLHVCGYVHCSKWALQYWECFQATEKSC